MTKATAIERGTTILLDLLAGLDKNEATKAMTAISVAVRKGHAKARQAWLHPPAAKAAKADSGFARVGSIMKDWKTKK